MSRESFMGTDLFEEAHGQGNGVTEAKLLFNLTLQTHIPVHRNGSMSIQSVDMHRQTVQYLVITSLAENRHD
jgi:hypothetical protein